MKWKKYSGPLGFCYKCISLVAIYEVWHTFLMVIIPSIKCSLPVSRFAKQRKWFIFLEVLLSIILWVDIL